MSRKSRTFVVASIAPTPWKNGGGTTRELACWPDSAAIDGFQWRVSIAAILRDGPFSVFRGIDRTILLIEGAGVRLRSANGDIDHRLDTPWQPFAFPGEAAIDCHVLGGESQDFNVMSRRQSVRSEVRILRDAASLQPSPHGLLFAGRGSWHAREVLETQPLSAGYGLWWGDETRQWSLEPDAIPAPGERVLIAVQLWPAT